MKYLYLPDCRPEDELAVIIRAFEAAGYDSIHACKGPSVGQAAEQLASGDVLAIYSFDAFDSVAELSDLLVRMEERGVLLQSLCEPWINETIRDHAGSVGKMRYMISRVAK